MTTEGQVSQRAGYEPPSRNTTLIESLREQPNFLMEKYNEDKKAENQANGIKRAGGVYIPPHKLRQLQEELMDADPESEAHQKLMWELLRKSINGIVNKVNISNIQNVVVELFNQNVYRGRGLLARSIIKAQMASPNFTHVYAALIAVINTKVPQIGLLIAKRVLIQFKRSFERNNKIVCVATTRMIAHLVNQRVIGQYIALQILLILLTTPTQDSVEIACDFMVEVGQVLSEITPAGATAIFERFKGLLHQAEIEQKAQYSIQNLFAVRKTGFKQHPGVIPELDLVEPEDQITHQMDIEEPVTGEDHLNIFKNDPNYLQTEEQWEQIKLEILGEENLARLKEVEEYQDEWDEEPQEEGIQDLTEQDLINLRKTIYLAIQSTVNFEECAHKIMKMNIAKGYEHELVDMILECCMMERIYQSFFGLLAERFCLIDDKFKQLFVQAFLNHYNNIFKQEANKIRNLALLFGHLFYRKAIDWRVFQAIRLTPDSTTAAARMFLKILLKQVAENMGINRLAEEFHKDDMRQYYEGLFPIDNPSDLRFAINYYTAIGLGKLTEEMRQVLTLQEEIINERRKKEEQAMARQLLLEEEEMMRLAFEEQQVKEEPQHQQRERPKKIKQQPPSKSRSRSKQHHKQKRKYSDESLSQKQKERKARREKQRRRERQQRAEKEERQQRKKAQARQERARQQLKRKQEQEERARKKKEEQGKKAKERQARRRKRSNSESKEKEKKRREKPRRRRSSSSQAKGRRKASENVKKRRERSQSESSSGISSSSSQQSSSSSVKVKKGEAAEGNSSSSGSQRRKRVSSESSS